MDPRWVESQHVLPCRGAAVFLPGPLKERARAEPKIQADYSAEPDPPAASLLDLVRATVVFEEPYSLACFVKFVQKNYRVARLKNRFECDSVEKVSAARLQQEFYAAEAWGYDDTSSVHSSGSGTSGRSSYDKMYRDVMLNIEVPRANGPPFIAELQVALSGIAILKKSEQKVYSIMRMDRASDLRDTFVFSKGETPRHSASPRRMLSEPPAEETLVEPMSPLSVAPLSPPARHPVASTSMKVSGLVSLEPMSPMGVEAGLPMSVEPDWPDRN
jgi:hypothetical protein